MHTIGPLPKWSPSLYDEEVAELMKYPERPNPPNPLYRPAWDPSQPITFSNTVLDSEMDRLPVIGEANIRYDRVHTRGSWPSNTPAPPGSLCFFTPKRPPSEMVTSDPRRAFPAFRARYVEESEHRLLIHPSLYHPRLFVDLDANPAVAPVVVR